MRRAWLFAALLAGVSTQAIAQPVGFGQLPVEAQQAVLGHWRQSRASPYACLGRTQKQFTSQIHVLFQTDYNRDGRPDYLFQSPCEASGDPAVGRTKLVVSDPLGYRIATRFDASLNVLNGRPALLAGCEGAAGDCQLARILDPATDTWSEPAPIGNSANGAEIRAAPAASTAALSSNRNAPPPPASPPIPGPKPPVPVFATASTINAGANRVEPAVAPAPPPGEIAPKAAPPLVTAASQAAPNVSDRQARAEIPAPRPQVGSQASSVPAASSIQGRPTAPTNPRPPGSDTPGALDEKPAKQQAPQAKAMLQTALEVAPLLADVVRGAASASGAAPDAKSALPVAPVASVLASLARSAASPPAARPAEATRAAPAAPSQPQPVLSRLQAPPLQTDPAAPPMSFVERMEAQRVADEERRRSEAQAVEEKWKVPAITLADLPKSWAIDRDRDYRGYPLSLLTLDASEYARAAHRGVPGLDLYGAYGFETYNRALDTEFRARRLSRTDGDSIALIIAFFAENGRLAELKRYVDFYANTASLARMSPEDRLEAAPQYLKCCGRESNHRNDNLWLINNMNELERELKPRFSGWLKARLDAAPGVYSDYDTTKYDIQGWRLGESGAPLRGEAQRQEINGMLQEQELRNAGALTGSGWKPLGRTVGAQRMGANWSGNDRSLEVEIACEAQGSKIYELRLRQGFESANHDAVVQKLKDKYGEPSVALKAKNGVEIMVWGARYPNSLLRTTGYGQLDGLVATFLSGSVELVLTDRAHRVAPDRCTADAKAAQQKADLAKVKF